MPPTLVPDFDGTITRRDYYRLILDRLAPPDFPDPWPDYLAGRLTHFEALRRIYAAADPGEPALLALLDLMEPDPDLADAVRSLRRAGWRVVVASAGCAWYIDRLLARAGVALEVHANPGRVVDGRLLMEPPAGSPFFSPETGIDKSAVVRSALARGPSPVAFAGDGLPDLAPSLLVTPSLRFARGALAAELSRLGHPFLPFDRWSDIAHALLTP